ncbi:MAG: hypothetical protein OEV59_04440 [Deltaproteobacteria bacterium]|nr:hypothetical protein [Deltaproteobacteria bacterium]
MSRELTPWRFVVNCLHVAKGPIKIDSEFWKYTSTASAAVSGSLKNVTIVSDHYSLDEVINFKPILLCIDYGKKTIELDKSIDENYLNNIVNYGIDDDIKKKLPGIIDKAYQEFKGYNK